MECSPGSEAEAGDYVGVESCIDLRNEEIFEAYVRDCEWSYERRRRSRMEAEVVAGMERRRRRRRDVREFPPPITYLARTDQNQTSHMSWVMKRHYTADGRLVIREEKVRHHEYFRAHRADGRLTLQLIPLDDYEQSGNSDPAEHTDDDHSCTEVVNESAEKEMEENVEVALPVMASSLSMSALCIAEDVTSGGGYGGGRGGGMLTSASASSLAGVGGGKMCSGFNSLRSSSASSLFHLQVPAIRPVIS